MKRQYNEIKRQCPDCLLFFRLGDFYEMFDEDARLAGQDLRRGGGYFDLHGRSAPFKGDEVFREIVQDGGPGSGKVAV